MNPQVVDAEQMSSDKSISIHGIYGLFIWLSDCNTVLRGVKLLKVTS